jgi:hypothetical protein
MNEIYFEVIVALFQRSSARPAGCPTIYADVLEDAFEVSEACRTTLA